MANTNSLKRSVEPFVRAWLSKRYGKQFHDRDFSLPLSSGGKHLFDAVSVDEQIVCEIKSSKVKSDNRIGTGPIHAASSALLFLSMVSATQRLLIFTDQRFYDRFTGVERRRIPPGVQVAYCPLPDDLEAMVQKMHDDSSDEIGKK